MMWHVCGVNTVNHGQAIPQARHDKYEIAIYAALSGHLARLLDVCHTWYDQLWAYLRSLVDVRVEQEVRLRCFTFRERVDLPLQYWDGLWVMVGGGCLSPTRGFCRRLESGCAQRWRFPGIVGTLSTQRYAGTRLCQSIAVSTVTQWWLVLKWHQVVMATKTVAWFCSSTHFSYSDCSLVLEQHTFWLQRL